MKPQGSPPYHCDLSAVEFIWNNVKIKVAHRNVGQIATELQIFMKKLAEIQGEF
jgi:hypothetical protein